MKWWCGGVAWLGLCKCACSHLYACALLQSGGAMYVEGAGIVTVSGGSTITSSTAQGVHQQRGCESVSVCVHVCMCLCAGRQVCFVCVACCVCLSGDAVVMVVWRAAEQQASVWVLVRDGQRRGAHSLGRGRKVCECAGWCVGAWLHW